MNKQKSGDNIRVGNITNSTGIAIGHNAKANVDQYNGTGIHDIEKAFTLIAKQIQTMPDDQNKNDAIDAVKNLEQEAKKGEKADEGRIKRWLQFLAETAPDVWDVAVTTLSNPIAGLGKVFQKIAKRAGEGKA
jgi:hypothetical protein